MKFYTTPKTIYFVKLLLLFSLISVSSKGQVSQKDSAKISLHEQYVNYMTKAHASLGTGIFFESAATAVLLILPASPILVLGAVLAIGIGTIALIDSYFLRQKANRLILKRQRVLQEKLDRT